MEGDKDTEGDNDTEGDKDKGDKEGPNISPTDRIKSQFSLSEGQWVLGI